MFPGVIPGETKAGGLPLFNRRGDSPDEKKESVHMSFTLSDFIQFCIFVVTLVSLCYQIFREKK